MKLNPNDILHPRQDVLEQKIREAMVNILKAGGVSVATIKFELGNVPWLVTVGVDLEKLGLNDTKEEGNDPEKS